MTESTDLKKREKFYEDYWHVHVHAIYQPT